LPLWLSNTLLFPLVFLNLWLLTISIDYVQPLLSIVLVSVILAIVLDFPIKFLQGQGMPRRLKPDPGAVAGGRVDWGFAGAAACASA
jgi:predicted PurR-regulated permease PerM